MTQKLAIFSTLSSDVDFEIYSKDVPDGALPQVARTLRINGKANLATKTFLTPRGAVTRVTPEELELLESHPVFIRQRKNGFLSVEAASADIDKVVSDMVPRDNSAPLEPGDLDDNGPTQIISAQQAAAAEEERTSATVETKTTGVKRRRNTSRATTKKADAE